MHKYLITKCKKKILKRELHIYGLWNYIDSRSTTIVMVNVDCTIFYSMLYFALWFIVSK